MLRPWMLLVPAVTAGLFAFGPLPVAAAVVAKVLLFVFVALFVIGLLRGRRPT